MEKYKSGLKRKIWIFLAEMVGILFYLNFVFSKQLNQDAGAVQGFFHGFQVGILIAMMGFILYEFIKILGALRNDDKLQAMYVDETDERKKMIRCKMGQMSTTVNYSVLIVATVVAGFFDEKVFSTLVVVLLFFALTMIVGKIYYNRKY